MHTFDDCRNRTRDACIYSNDILNVTWLHSTAIISWTFEHCKILWWHPIFIFLLLISCRHACKRAHMLKQFCKKESKFSCRKHLKKITNLNKNDRRHTQTHKELKTRLVACEQIQMKANCKMVRFFIARVHLQRTLLICTYAFPLQWICDCVGLLIIALTVRISNPSTWASQCAKQWDRCLREKLKWHVREQRMKSDEVVGRMIKVKRMVQMEKCGKDKSIVGSLWFYMTHKMTMLMLLLLPLLLMMMNKCQFMKQKSPDK